KVYIVKRHRTTGELSCACPAWKFKKGDKERTCKHVVQAAAGVVPVIQPAPEPEAVRPTEDVVGDLMTQIEDARADKQPIQSLGDKMKELD
ncbi:hypothetical protein LCGC14_1758110, partial [marine sediment metagenome]